MQAVLSIILSTIAVFVAANILPGVHVDSFLTAMVVAVVLGFINAFIRPIIFLLTLPINLLTLGLFTFVIIGGLVMLVSAIVPGFHVDGFFWALAFAFVLALVNLFVRSIIEPL
jgi:putative membrane protein